MKKNYFGSLLLGMLITFTGHSQSFSGYGSTPSNDNYNYINYSNDTMYYTFNTLPGGAYEDATLTIDGSAYFTPGSFYKVYGPGSTLLGTFSYTDYNCTPFSTPITIPFATINGYGGSAILKLVKQGSIYPYCSNSRLRLHLNYRYCATGVATQQADFSLSDNLFCQSDVTPVLTGTPAGGTFSGPGVSGNTLAVSALPYGIYYVTYTYTEANGCYTQDSASFTVLENPDNRVAQTCQNTSPVVNTGNVSYVYASDLGLSNVLGTGTNVTLPAITNTPTDIWTAVASNPFYYVIDTMDTTGYQMVDHDLYSGDDRGGIAVNENYVYIVGDDATARFDLDLQNGVDLVKRDGMFTDLAQVKLYTLYNTAIPHTPNGDNSGGFTMNSLRSLNDDLSLGNELIMLSQPVTIGNVNQGVILAGYNELIVGTAYGNYDFYHISIQNGLVTPIGQHQLDVYGSENWADWGMSGFDGTDRHAYFRDENDSIVDFNFTTNTSTAIFPITDLSDLSSFIAHPLNHRIYAHYEGNTSTFGGDEETLMYFQIADSSNRLAATTQNYGCPSKVTYTFNTLDLGADTTVCSEDGLYIIPGGNGFATYTWNGVNNNYNSYPVQHTEQVTLSVTDNINCTLTDTIVVTMIDCTAGINELGTSSIVVYPVPNNGSFQIAFDALTTDANLVIVDAQGKQVANQSVAQGQTTIGMNLQVQPGIYFVRLVSENGSFQQAISIQ